MAERQPDLFAHSRDAEILAAWRAGANLDDIAALIGVPVMRACHEVNRILNAAAQGLDFASVRNR